MYAAPIPKAIIIPVGCKLLSDPILDVKMAARMKESIRPLSARRLPRFVATFTTDVGVEGVLLRSRPQCLQTIAAAWMVSAQKGHVFVASDTSRILGPWALMNNGMALLCLDRGTRIACRFGRRDGTIPEGEIYGWFTSSGTTVASTIRSAPSGLADETVDTTF